MSGQLPPYVNERLDNQIEWYGKKSAFNKLRFRICQLIVIVASATIPIVNLGIPLINKANPDYVTALGITAVLGGAITIVTAISQMDAYFQTWVLYRTTTEALKRERYLYENNAGDYSELQEPVKNKLLVERIEAMLSSENSKFLSLQQNAKQQTEQQLSELLQKQREINKQQRDEILEIQEFKKKYERSKIIELMRSGLIEMTYPISKNNIQAYIEKNKSKLEEAEKVRSMIENLPSKDYDSFKEIENELLK